MFGSTLNRRYTLGRLWAVPVYPVSPLKYSAAFSLVSKRLISTDQYHELADEALESITDSFEQLIDEKPEIDADLSQGVLTLIVPPIGTYVINKQPPNMQVWLSSPISGPKRFDWDEHSNRWVYSRDQSTLGAVLKQETKDRLNLTLDLDLE